MSPDSTPAPGRLVSLDAYRGFVMLAMASHGLGLAQVASDGEVRQVGAAWRDQQDSGTVAALQRFAGNAWLWIWDTLAYQFSHVDWIGGSFWDMIQPSFLFIVGVSLAFSVARRREQGQGFGRMLGHAVVRSLILIFLGVLLYSDGHTQTNFTFVNVLAQIGLGYTFAFLLTGYGWFIPLFGAAIIAGLYGAAFVRYGTPSAADIAALGIPDDWRQFEGFAAAWNKHVNAAGGIDRWLLNRLPRAEPFVYNGGGYQTLNFIPSIATMLLGVSAGEWLASDRAATRKRSVLFLSGGLLIVAAFALDHTLWPDWFIGLVHRLAGLAGLDPQTTPYLSPAWTVCPAVKRIWTPMWVVYSGGWTLLLMGLFYWLVDMRGWRRLPFVFIVIGANSIAVYLTAELANDWIAQTLQTHLGQEIFAGAYGPIVQSLAVLLVIWLLAWWLFRQGAFLRI